MPETGNFFTRGKLSIILDAQAGSSGKGNIGSFITKHANGTFQFAANAFLPQAGHTVIDGGKKYFYQTFNSCAYQDNYEKLYIGPGACIELPALFREMEESRIKPRKIGIHPLAAILQDKDAAFERGEVDFDGYPLAKRHDGTMKHGSTCHGVGANRARRVLRNIGNLLLARDVPELREFICDTSQEMMDRLDKGQSGLLEIAQGFQLSLMGKFFPYCTSRNVTVSAGLDDMMLPPVYAGNVLLNLRTYPIRINNFKFLDPETGSHLTWAQVQEYEKLGKKYTKYEGNSGGWYPDQTELTWEEVTQRAGSPKPIFEITSVTKLPRRVATFSQQNLVDAIRWNQTGYGKTHLSLNFANYVDHSLSGVRGGEEAMTPKITSFVKENLAPVLARMDNVQLSYIGTGPETDDKIVLR